tara:strand:+ start:508 stop:696 length:189 start_codon:yes stop_codon:yes gene_type:complete
MSITDKQVREAAVDVIQIILDSDNLNGSQTKHENSEDEVVKRLSKLLSLASDKAFIGGKRIG